MKGKFGKIGIISLALVIALAGLGVGFAQWTETLAINSSVSTGELKLELTNIRPSDELGDISCTKTGWGDDFQTFTLTVEHAYPGYAGTVMFDITNTGSIPAYIDSVAIQPIVPPGIPLWAHITTDDIWNAGGVTLNPSQSVEDRFIEVEIDGDGGVPENYGPFGFTVTIHAIQWNYAP